jgi:hypothetical protein
MCRLSLFDKGYMPWMDFKLPQFYRTVQKAKECGKHFTPEAIAELQLENKVICGFLRFFAVNVNTSFK